MEEKFSKEMGDELLKISQAKYKSAQEKYNAIQSLAKKYKMPLDRLLTNIIKEWVDEDRQKKFDTMGKGKS